MLCPVCDAENAPAAQECEVCGKALAARAAPDAPADSMPELERTPVAPEGLAVEVQPLEVARTALEAPPPGTQSFWDAAPPELEPAQPAAPAGAPSFWDATPPDLDTGRAEDEGAVSRPAPRPEQPKASRKSQDPVLCPACFSRVEPGPRCVECGVPFPPALHAV